MYVPPEWQLGDQVAIAAMQNLVPHRDFNNWLELVANSRRINRGRKQFLTVIRDREESLPTTIDLTTIKL